MFVSIRRYFVHKAPANELAELVDRDFADRLSAQPGFVSYEFLDGGEGEAMTISAFHEAARGCPRSRRTLSGGPPASSARDASVTGANQVREDRRYRHDVLYAMAFRGCCR